MKLFIINAGQEYGGSKGELNGLLSKLSKQFFEAKGAEVKMTTIHDGYDIEEEVSRFVWADLIIYHTPIWWFYVPADFKKYIDEVLSAGGGRGIFHSDGRRSDTPKLHYGTGGDLQGRKYLLTTTWNAPEEAFTLPGEIFQQTSVDDGVMNGFHIMNSFIGLESLPSIHFYDVMKDTQIENYKNSYLNHLEKLFTVLD